MKKTIVALIAASLLAASVPAMAADGGAHATQHDQKCLKECQMLARNCSQESESIQQQIARLRDAIRNNAESYSAEELQTLKAKLKDAESVLTSLQSAGA